MFLAVTGDGESGTENSEFDAESGRNHGRPEAVGDGGGSSDVSDESRADTDDAGSIGGQR